jgi:transcription initiation factor IIE alpha subunit
MAERLARDELEQFNKLLSSIEKLLISHATHVDAVTQLLIRKDVFTDEELSAELKQVQTEYKSKANA